MYASKLPLNPKIGIITILHQFRDKAARENLRFSIGAGGGILALRFEPATSGLKAFAPFVLQIMSLAP
jgi:hypothetical protein